MKLEDAIKALQPITNVPFKNFLTEKQLKNIRTNKGLTGQLLEIQLGLKNSSRNLDFEDGELKSNKVALSGKPLETMYIKQISRMIDDLLNEYNFFETKLYKKIDNILYVPVYKGTRKNWVDRKEWRLLPHIHIKLPEHPEILNQLEKDYYKICKLMNKQLNKSSQSLLHTCNGKYIQIRTKDSKPYNKIYSKKYNRIVSDKNRAFYFKKEFMIKIHEISSDYPIQL